MCFQVYFSSDTPCPEIPYVESPRGESVNLHVHRTDMSSDGLTKSYRYHVGVMSCGCGFAYFGSDRTPEDSMSLNHAQLSDYLERCLQDTQMIEVFSCWSGDEYKGVSKERHITVEDTRDLSFYFEEHQRTLVFRDRATLEAATSNTQGA